MALLHTESESKIDTVVEAGNGEEIGYHEHELMYIELESHLSGLAPD